MLDPSVIRRLAFIKYLYRVGVQQSKAPEPLANAALLTFHDAVELFLQLSAEHLNAEAKKNQEFIGYWPLISQKMVSENGLSQQESMRRLNAARVSLKHSGTHPSKADLEAFRATTFNFFEDNVYAIFGLHLSDVSLIAFVQPESASERLRCAEKLMLESSFDEASAEVAIAFDEMISDYEARKRDRFHRSPFAFGRNIGHKPSFELQSLSGRGTGGREIARYLDSMHESISAMQKAMRVIAFGIDFRRYSRFQSFTPSLIRTLDGTYHVHDMGGEPRTKGMLQFCVDFVIESAIQLREFDYDVEELPQAFGDVE